MQIIEGQSNSAAVSEAANGKSETDSVRALVQSAQDYSALCQILNAALAQASTGKGKERHANGLPWTEQPIMQIGRRHGVGFNTGQAEKKLGEAQGMLARGQPDAAVAEILGAIVYAASAVFLISEKTDAIARKRRADVEAV